MSMSCDTSHSELTLPPSFAKLERSMRAMIRQTIANSSKLKMSKDKSFGALAAIAGFVRSAQAGEGYLIEAGTAEFIKSTGRFLVFKDIRIPGAQEHGELDDGYPELANTKRRGKTLPKRGYRPDIVLVERTTGLVSMIEVKRTSESYLGWQLGKLARRMAASSSGLVPILETRCQGLRVKTVDVIILDASDNDSNEVVTRISSLDNVLGIAGLSDAVGWLRQEYALTVQRAFLEKISAFFRLQAKQQGKASISLVRDHERDESRQLWADMDSDGHAYGSEDRQLDLDALHERTTVRIVGNLS